jgi:uncharacterized protein YdhG (YjbR/CyaY superfamily)
MAEKKTEKSYEGFSAEERDAMKERAKELKGSARKGKVDGETDLLSKIDEMPKAEQVIAKRIHEIVKEVAPDLTPKTWYGQPAWAKGGKVVVFFQSAAKFNTRYGTLGFSEDAALDDGEMWATSFAVTAMNDAIAAKIAKLVKKAAG